MQKYHISNTDARKFILVKQGLLGDYLYHDQTDILKFVEKVGCIQYDPIDVCGKNAELVLQSRFSNFKKSMLFSELYEKRNLIDYWDKNMSIYSVADWPYFRRIREDYKSNNRHQDELEPLFSEVEKNLEAKEYITSKDLEYSQKVNWYWTETTKSRALLETMFFNGDVVIHHRKQTIRYFSLSKSLIDKNILNQSEPNLLELDYKMWRVLRRINAVGMLWNRPSDAFLGIKDLKAEERNLVFNKLLSENKIIAVKVENIEPLFYIDSKDEDLLKDVISNAEYLERTEFIAALDNLIWDRKLIKQIFNFDYTWEIYTPASKRKYGYYVLPIIQGISFIGRIEIIVNRKKKTLNVNNIWLENNIKLTNQMKDRIIKAIEKFMIFNEADIINYHNDFVNKLELSKYIDNRLYESI